ncbi:MAG TPA: universal stress protein [Bacteroidia bacterium]|jgi:nucleotide-binding universal stress UspA family protein|nr:universal stress protein [Bacteroidia bacterium]
MKTILIATDFSPAADNASDYGSELAKYFNAKLILLNVYPLPQANYDTGIPPDTITILKQVSLDSLNEVKTKLLAKSPGIEIECITVMGGTYDSIEQISKENDVDLVVMGIIGHAGILKEHLIGSNAVKTAKHLQLPVFIIPQDVKYKRIQKLSFACDMNHTEETGVIYLAKYFAKLFDAELEVVNIEQPGKELTPEKANTFEFVEEKLHSVAHRIFTVSDENPVHGLEDYYKRYPVDAVMLNTKKHNVFHNLFIRSVIKKMVFHTNVPLLIMH